MQRYDVEGDVVVKRSRRRLMNERTPIGIPLFIASSEELAKGTDSSQEGRGDEGYGCCRCLSDRVPLLSLAERTLRTT